MTQPDNTAQTALQAELAVLDVKNAAGTLTGEEHQRAAALADQLADIGDPETASA